MDHATAVAGIALRVRGAEVGDREEQVVGGDVRTDGTAGRRAVEETGQDRTDPLREVPAESLERRIPGVQRRRQAALSPQELRVLVDPVCKGLVWGPLGQGLLTGRVRRGQENDLVRARFVNHVTDERRIDVVEQYIKLADEAGMPLTHLATAFTIAHPGVTSAIVGPRTMDHLDDLLDRIDEIVPPGTDVGVLDQAYQPPAVGDASLRRRPIAGRAAAA